MAAEDQEVVYFVAIRTTTERGGAEVQEVLKRLNEEGLLPKEPRESPDPVAVAWVKPYSELTANHNGYLQELGLEDFGQRNEIATVAWENK